MLNASLSSTLLIFIPCQNPVTPVVTDSSRSNAGLTCGKVRNTLFKTNIAISVKKRLALWSTGIDWEVALEWYHAQPYHVWFLINKPRYRCSGSSIKYRLPWISASFKLKSGAGVSGNREIPNPLIKNKETITHPRWRPVGCDLSADRFGSNLFRGGLILFWVVLSWVFVSFAWYAGGFMWG